MSEQPEALRLADALQAEFPGYEVVDVSAAELRRLHALNDELTKAYRKMHNAAAGYSNYCEDSASVRRCERDFEEADTMFRAALAQKCCKNTT